jgi:hypothetical protein
MTPVIIDITYDLNADKATFGPNTNAKTEAIPEIITAYLRDQMGQGEDLSPPNHQSLYHIKLGLDLTDDSFRVEHDCGNEGLSTGILLLVLKGLT